MTRTGKAVRLARHAAEPTLSMHPEDARVLELREGAFARIDSTYGSASLRIAHDSGLPRGSVFAPFHWNNATSGLARIDAVAQPLTDSVSGQPELKATPVRITPLAMACEGVLVSRVRITLPEWLQHTRITIPGGEALLFASTRTAQAIHALLSNHLGAGQQRAELADGGADDFRTVVFDGERLGAALFVQARRDTCAVEWLIESLEKQQLTLAERKAVLAGVPPEDVVDRGPLVCSCFAVRRAAITEAVRSGARSIEAVGKALKAGTNCGSCRPEINQVINDECASSPEKTAA
jgi:assimilatory nitrate reductase catalytic subunit